MNITIVYNGIIPSVKYGGTQRVIWGLGKALHDMSHRVTFVVARGSWCPFADVVAIDNAKGVRGQIPADTDIVHFQDHVPDDCVSLTHVLTINGNGAPAALDPNAIFVSKNHAERFGSDCYVYNGLLWEDYGKPDLKLRRFHYHFLGKAAWHVKNLSGAMDVVRHLQGGELDVLGGYRLNLKMGFRLTLNPHVHFYGMVDNDKKQEIIQQSKGLLFPVTWHEPFGLAVIESLFYGAPVFGTPYGSLPELVPTDLGYLTNDAHDMVEHIKGFEWSPERCNEYAVDKFNAGVMARHYLEKYETVLNGHLLNGSYRQGLQKKDNYNLPWHKWRTQSK